LAQALTTAYGPLPDEAMIYLARGIFRVTQSLEDGNLPLAMIKAVHLKITYIATENIAGAVTCKVVRLPISGPLSFNINP
jgi:hypothetical protein